MEQNGYTEESYEEWKENDMRTELFSESMEELTEKRLLLGVLRNAMDSLLPEERELAMKVFGEEIKAEGGSKATEKDTGKTQKEEKQDAEKVQQENPATLEGIRALLSASSSRRWLFCTPSARLEEQFKDEEGGSVYDEEDTAAHALAEHKLKKISPDTLLNMKYHEIIHAVLDLQTDVNGLLWTRGESL